MKPKDLLQFRHKSIVLLLVLVIIIRNHRETYEPSTIKTQTYAVTNNLYLAFICQKTLNLLPTGVQVS